MVVYYPTVTIPLLGLVIALWLILCHYTRKRGGGGEEEEAWPPSSNNSASVYIIPMHEREEDAETDSRDPISHTSYSVPPVYGSGNISPPPYRCEPPSYSEPPPPYIEPEVSPQQPCDSSASSSTLNPT